MPSPSDTPRAPGTGGPKQRESNITKRRRTIQEAVGRVLTQLHKEDPARYPNPVTEYGDVNGYDPLIAMAKLGHDQSLAADLRATMHSKIAAFMHPQLRAIEVTGEDGDPIKVEAKVGKVEKLIDLMLTQAKKNAAG